MIRHDYPNIHKWLQHIYWDVSSDETRGAFAKTTHFRDVGKPPHGMINADIYRLLKIKGGYAHASRVNIVPLGPVPDVVPITVK